MGTGQPPRGEADAVEDKCSFEPWGGGEGMEFLTWPFLYCVICVAMYLFSQ